MHRCCYGLRLSLRYNSSAQQRKYAYLRCVGWYCRMWATTVSDFSFIVFACICVSVCSCVCVCVNHGLVRTITHHSFKLESPILEQRCKRPWLRCLLFLGMIDLDLQGQIKLESQILPHFELVCPITRQPFKLESPNLDRKCILALSRSLSILDLIGFDPHCFFNLETDFSTKFICALFVLYLVRPVACKY